VLVYADAMTVCWQGAGTAIGELPPYFMARAARLSGNIDEEEQEVEELMEEQRNAEHLVWTDALQRHCRNFYVKWNTIKFLT